MNKAKSVAGRSLCRQGEAAQEAMEKMSKYKQKYSSVQSLSELPKKKPNAIARQATDQACGARYCVPGAQEK